MTDVLDDTIRSFLIELVDATPPPPEFDEIATESWPRSHNDAATGPRWSQRRSGLVAAAVACAVALAMGLAILVIDAGGTHSHMPATNSTSPSKGYYQARTTLIVDLSPRANQSPLGLKNLAQVALFVTRGEVPDAVAAKLGGKENGPQLAQRITTKTDRSTSTVAITAVARTPEQAVQLADAFSAELVQAIAQKDTSSFNSERDQLQVRLDDLISQINALTAQIAANPPNADALKAQLQAVQNQYQFTYVSFQQLAAQGPPASRFTTMEKARAVRINKTEYDKRLHSAP